LNGTVSFNTDKVSVTGLPSGTLTPGTTVTAHVHVTNTGPEPESYQVDPRTGSQVRYVAQSVNGVTSGTLPVTGGTPVPQYAVPPFSSGLNLSTSTTGSTPITFDVSSFWGAPDVMAAPSTAGTTSISLQNPIASEWGLTPDEIGPFGSGPAKSEDYSTGGTVDTSGFDGTAVPDTGDIWEAIFTGGGGSLNPLYLQPGQSGTINVTFTVPKGTTGSKVAGELAVETFNFNALTTGIADWSSDVLGILPYSYKLGS
jgi:hypothetical protein